jgi:hypothetical protein
MRHKVIEQLRTTFATLFPDETTQRRVLADAGIAIGNIHFPQAALNAWYAILEEAGNQSKMDALLNHCATNEYATNPDLIFCRLLWIVYQIDWEMQRLRQLYTHTITNYTAIKRTPIADFEDIIDILKDLWRPNEEISRKVTAVVEFVVYLHQDKINESSASLLQDWLVDSQNKLRDKINQQRITEIRQQLPRSGNFGEPTCLLVVIEPSRNGRKRSDKKSYLLKTYLWDGKKAEAESIEERPLSFEKVQAKIDTIRRTILRRYRRTIGLRIEYFLPIELLLTEGDQWQIPDRWLLPSDEPLPLEYRDEYCIVFRSLERLYRPEDYQIRWNEKWSKFPLADRIAIDRHFEWLDKGFNHSLGALSELRAKLLREENLTCVGLSTLPDHLQARFDIFKTLFRLGIPVIIWSRHPAAPITREFLHTLIPSHICWEQLPEYLQKSRLQREKSIQEFANHLTVLWDDPYRVPPEHLLSAPEHSHHAKG